jgi:hypothetical protein
MTDDDADRPEPLSAKAITALLREARSLSRRADKLGDTAAAVGDSTTQQLAAEACTSVEPLVHHLTLAERQVQRGEKGGKPPNSLIPLRAGRTATARSATAKG